MAGKIRVTLRRSMIGEKPKTRQTVRGLGLNKLHSSNDLPDNASVRGMLHKVRHLIEVEETPDAKRKKNTND